MNNVLSLRLNKQGEGFETDGVRGLKMLGVRDLTYRLAFLACSVVSSETNNVSNKYMY